MSIDLEAVTWTGSLFVTGGQYVAVGGSATILTSPDGITWTPRDAPVGVTQSLRGVTANESLIVAVGNNGAILTSLTGETWTARASGVTSSLQDAVWDGSRFIVVGSGDIILTSTDGVAWQPGDPGSSGVSYFGAAHWASALLPASLRVAGGSSGTIVTSIDASDWLPLPSGTSRQLNGITWLDDQMRTHFVIVGNEGTVLTNIR
jgi:hypothetical protein